MTPNAFGPSQRTKATIFQYSHKDIDMPSTLHGYVETSSTESLRQLLRPIDAIGGIVKLLVSGPDGSGKAFLVQRIANEVNSNVLIIRGEPDSTGTPFKPVGEALRAFFEAEENKQLAIGVIGIAAKLVPVFGSYIASLQELATEWGKSKRSKISSAFEPADGVLEILNKLSKSRPVLLLLENIQSYDRDTIDLLNSIVYSTKVNFSIVLTADPGYRIRKDFDYEHFSLNLTSVDLTRRAAFKPCFVRNLTQGETVEFLKYYWADARFNDSEAEIIYSITNGNPHLIFAAVDEWLTSSSDSEDGGRHHIRLRYATDDHPVPRSISDYAVRRLRSLDKPTKDILTHASVIGPEVNSQLLATILGRTEEAVGDDLKEIEREYGLLTMIASGVYKFSGSLSYIAVYSTIDIRSAQLKNERVATALSEIPGTPPYVVYRYLLRAGRVPEAMAHLRELADNLVESLLKLNEKDGKDLEVSEQIAEAAKTIVPLFLELGTVARLKLVPGDEIAKLDERTYQVGVALGEKKQFTLAITLFQYLYHHACRVECRAWSLLKTGSYQWVSGDSAAVEPLEQVLEVHSNEIGDEGLLEARLTLASVLYHLGNWEAAKKRYRECFVLPHLRSDSVLLANTRRNINMFYISDLALPLLKSSLSELSRAGKPEIYWELYHNMGCIHLLCGELDEAWMIFTAVEQTWRDSGNYKVGLAKNNLGILDVLNRNYEAAQRRFNKIVDDPISDYEEVSGRCHLAIIDVINGNPQGLETLRELTTGTDSPKELPLRDVLLYNLGWALYETGEYREAQIVLRSASALPVRPNPWKRFQSARIARLLRKVENGIGKNPVDATESRPVDAGRRDRWAYEYPEFAFSELWCWE